MTVRILKLASGEELIAEEEGSNCFKRPRVIHPVQAQGGMSLAMIPWLMSDPEATVDIESKFIVAIIDAPHDIEKAYLQQTSGIALSQRLMG